jgi:hypothetical protein
MRSGERLQRFDIAVDSRHPEAHIEKQPGMASGAGGEVQHIAGWPDQRRKPPHPWRWRVLMIG